MTRSFVCLRVLFDLPFYIVDLWAYSRKTIKRAILPIAASTWWKCVGAGTFPPPVKFGRASLWELTDVFELVDRVGA